jgi:hypothetical protein
MVTKHGTSRLLRELRALYYRMCDNELCRRLGLYHRHTGSYQAPDISTQLEEHLDKLASTSRPDTVDTSSTSSTTASKVTNGQSNTTQSRKRRYGIFRSVTIYFHSKKTFTPLKTNDPYLGDKLKDSTWSHIHTAQLQARQGNTINAKLHAGIANDALKEAAHYMSDKDYQDLCNEVTAIFKKLERA